ncbi:divergent polysaccharide deacetylase family protein [Teichococcus vastitatis]|uniref:Divergent polysaccharide deacetylase family protein n=1 Tax=Teichococcus vastitatis TaxID=2307076 RepID=A0ABS9W4D1_9PROT|nr:divergent polysaccharide deacetylase family protein [Pseudoroseomonas vastitatis]MCI0753908.1 divergent polysaccharide deacetylase family protein [Pseudoroseomonas vastitatis]
MSDRSVARQAWRALALFWGIVLVGAGGTALTLQQLGPPEPPSAASPPAAPSSSGMAADISPDASPPATLPDPAAPAADGSPAPATEPVTTAPLPPAAEPEPWQAPPEAPPPPPLPGARSEAAPPPVAAPDPALLEPSAHGPLPRIAADSRPPRQVYAAAAGATELPRIALVIGGLGLSAPRSEEAIRRLPAAATLALGTLPLRADLLLDQARRRGMEVLLALPLDSAGALPADHLMRASMPWEENAERLLRALGSFAGYPGTIGAQGGQRGERFAADPEQLRSLEAALQARGLFYIDPRPGAPAPAAVWGAAVDQVLDEPLTGGEVQFRLEALEAVARRRGSAIGLAGEPSPLLVDRIAAWAAGLPQRGLALVPVSAVVKPPADTP